MHHYEAFSLKIASRLCLPELLSCTSADEDVRIDIRPITADEHEGHNTFFIQGVGRYLIKNGREIIIDAVPGALEENMRIFLLGSAFGALLHQRQFLVLHANAIEIGDACILFVGASGFGKSTLAGAFFRQGNRVLADDVCAVDISNDCCAPRVMPSFPQIKLWKDMALCLGQDITQLRPIMNKIDKYAVVLKEQFCAMPKPVRAIFEIQVADSKEIQIINLDSRDRFQSLYNNTYRGYFLSSSQQKARHFHQCCTLANSICMTRVIRPRQGVMLDELVERIRAEL